MFRCAADRQGMARWIEAGWTMPATGGNDTSTAGHAPAASWSVVALNRRQARPLAGQADLDAESEGDKPRMTRLLSAGAKGAERVAQVAGVDRALNDAVEEA